MPAFTAMIAMPDDAAPPSDPDGLAARVQLRLDALGVSARDASLQVGTNADLIRNILRGKTLNPRADTLEKLAQVLQTTVEWLLRRAEPSSRTPPARLSQQPRQRLIARGSRSVARDLPVLGTAAGSLGRGAFQVTSDVIDYVLRPPPLQDLPFVYALRVEGDSMAPRYEPGELVIVHPKRQVMSGDDVILQIRTTHADELESYLKRFVKRTANKIVCTQFNPAATIEFALDRVVSMHRVLSQSDLWGG